MKDDAETERHNRLSRVFVQQVAGQAAREGATRDEIMVIFESVQMGMMDILSRIYRQTPSGSAELMELSLHRAVERFTDLVNKESK